MNRLQIWIAERSEFEFFLLQLSIVILGLACLRFAYQSEMLRGLVDVEGDEDEEESGEGETPAPAKPAKAAAAGTPPASPAAPAEDEDETETD